MSRFAPVVGQRTWVSERLGAVSLTTSGVAESALYRGTLLAADDALDSPTAVTAVRETLEARGITALPRTGRSA